ncbi:MAG: hypothetical protein DID91_2727702589 [Candidatus Nitrotoga sp. MKT]|nr:MAG: hypothetical protein DID91_2727702589 [Candidatus Nitrotoga sp. MKT]
MCDDAQTTFIISVILLTIGITMTAEVDGSCYLALHRSVSKKQLLKQDFSLFQRADESAIVVLRYLPQALRCHDLLLGDMKCH